MAGNVKRETPDLSALLGGETATVAVTAEKIHGGSPETDGEVGRKEQSKNKLIRSSVMMLEEQYENMRLLTWYLRKNMKDLWGEAISGLEEKYTVELKKAHEEYAAAGHPDLEFRGRR